VKKLSKLLLFVATVFFFSTVTEPISSLADSPPTQNFEEEFFNDKGNLEDLTYKELDNLSDSELKDLGVYTGEDAEEFTEEILDGNFDFEAAVEDLDISKMDYAEKDKFLKIVKETATISGTDEVELLEEALINLFDGSSETFNDLEATQQELEEKYEEQLNTDDDTLFSKIENFFAADKAYAAKKKGKIAVGVNLAAAAFNVVIFGVVGGTVFGVKNYIKKKGAKKAKETLSRVATAQAKKLKIKTIRGVSIATIIGVAIDFALNYYNPGSIIANIIDSKDWYKKNGWIDITK
jgi:hypothetical protein